MENIIVIIPAFNPDEPLMLDFINKLSTEFTNIVVINDGSDNCHNNFFNSLKEKKFLTVLTHCVNLGKGQALKTAINYTLVHFPKCKGIVTADCDGQHSIKDIKSCANKVLQEKDGLILGVRNFNQSDVPPRSRFGNKLTRTVFKLFIGLSITDTQTGLRGMSKKIACTFLETKGSRYEYESNMLIDCKLKEIPIFEIPIETIYINSNSGSHFNPLKDSLSIYKVFAKYILASVSSFLVDIILFTLFLAIFNATSLNFNFFTSTIILATICARLISSLYNFFINAKMVFKKMNNKSLIKYVLLVLIQMFVSGILVSYFTSLLFGSSATLVKIMVDSVIFVINFFIQREWIFKHKRKI
ncbi:MAG TPA: bifunctional glycosyltransferase family 2/GtrA family protein [Clostridia bacterium]|nr:bifunctional glycosyltransferase family 2/GtrA family protein [Clostridia bacterium]